MAGGPESHELVEVAFVQNGVEASMIQGLLETAGIPSIQEGVGIEGTRIGVGWSPNAPQRVMVNANRADEARTLVERTLAENEIEAISSAGTEALEEQIASGRARDYSLIGGYGRALLISIGVLGLAFGAFLLLRSL